MRTPLVAAVVTERYNTTGDVARVTATPADERRIISSGQNMADTSRRRPIELPL